MSNSKSISSLQNPLIKNAVQLRDRSRERKKTGLFILEGKRELTLAIKANYIIQTVFICKEIISDQEIDLVLSNIHDGFELIEVTKIVYHKMAYRESTEGILAIVKGKNHSLENIRLRKNALILVAEAPEKPGNIGALLRTADAANLDAVLIANPKVIFITPILFVQVWDVYSRIKSGWEVLLKLLIFLRRNK